MAQSRPLSQPNKMTGLGLLELLLALAVIAVILIISVNYYLNVRNEQKTAQFINQLSAISSGIATYVNSNAAKASSHPTAWLNAADIQDTLVSKNILTEADILNVWSPGYSGGKNVSGGEYYITVAFNTCVSVAVEVFNLPSQKYCVSHVQPKVTAAINQLQQITCGTGNDLYVRFCAE